jgi:hypothetical protein
MAPLELAPIEQIDITRINEKKKNISDLVWITKDKQRIKLGDMDDSHLRNVALVLMGMGYQTYICRDEVRVLWLTALRMEWEKRMLARTMNTLEHGE